MKNDSMKSGSAQPGAENVPYLFDDWFDPIEAGSRERVRGFIETMLEAELEAVLARPRYGRRRVEGDDEGAGAAGHRHGRRMRTLTGTFGATEIAVPRARLESGDGKRLRWQESGGPPVTPPGREGFGSRLMEHGLAQDLDGEVHLAYEPAGVVCEIVMPMSQAVEAHD